MFSQWTNWLKSNTLNQTPYSFHDPGLNLIYHPTMGTLTPNLWNEGDIPFFAKFFFFGKTKMLMTILEICLKSFNHWLENY